MRDVGDRRRASARREGARADRVAGAQRGRGDRTLQAAKSTSATTASAATSIAVPMRPLSP